MDRYNTLGRRVLAGWVDGLVFLPVSLADAWYLSAPERGAAIILIWGTLTHVSYWLYSVLLHTRYGQTLGKMAVGVKVLDVSEERIPTLRQAFLRDAGYIVLNCASLAYLFHLVLSGRYSRDAAMTGQPAHLLGMAGLAWVVLELVTTLTNSKRRAIHDFIARTVVVRIGAPDTFLDGASTVIPPTLPLACPRCGTKYPSRYYFDHPARPESVCTACRSSERDSTTR